MTAPDYQIAVGRKLRDARNALRLSLGDVQAKSRGKWPGSVVGSYERGNRSISVVRLCELAEFYGVAPSSLLPDDISAKPDVRVERLAEALHEAGIGPGEYAYDVARRLVLAGVGAPRTRKAGAA